MKVPFSLFMCKLKGFSFAYQKSSRAWFAWDGIIFFQYAEKDWYKDAYLRTSLQIKDCGGGKDDVKTFLFWLSLLNKPKLNFFALHSLLSTATLRYKKKNFHILGYFDARFLSLRFITFKHTFSSFPLSSLFLIWYNIYTRKIHFQSRLMLSTYFMKFLSSKMKVIVLHSKYIFLIHDEMTWLEGGLKWDSWKENG